MKLEHLAALLGKDAKELEGTLNLQSSEEVQDDILSREIQNRFKEIEINAKSNGKKEGEGMARRLVMTEAEKKLKERFEIEGDNFDHLIENLNVKMTSKFEGKADEKLVKEKDLWKTTAKDLESKLAAKDQEFESIRTKETIKSKLNPFLEKFEFVTPKIKEVALSEFINNKKFKIEGDDIYIEENGALFANFETHVEKHFSDYAKQKEQSKGVPLRSGNGTSYGNTMAELMTAIDKAKTSDEINAIRQKIETLTNVT